MKDLEACVQAANGDLMVDGVCKWWWMVCANGGAPLQLVIQGRELAQRVGERRKNCA